MYHFLDNQYLASRTMNELSAMLSAAYAELAKFPDDSYDRVLILAAIRKITSEMNRRLWNQARPTQPAPTL